MTRLLHRTIGQPYPIAASAKGFIIRDHDGNAYIDASGGAAVSCLGHGHPDVVAAMHRQIDTLDYAHTGFFSSQVAEDLADHLVAHAPPGMSHVYLVSGGSEAVETALKLARQYFIEIGQPQRRHFIARRQSYHGNTLGALAVGGNAWRREPFSPLLIPTHHVSPCYEYRDRRADETAEEYGARLAQELSDRIDELGPDNVIAFIAETVVGATAGAVPPVPGYFRHVRDICSRHGILLILDEVMSGMGRTGTLHACAQDGVTPDLMTIAKGLGGGFAPIGGVLVAEKVFDAFAKGSKTFQHGHTYLAHPLSCAAALAVQQVIQRDRLLDNVVSMGAHLKKRLSERFGNHHHVGDIRGRGLFMGIEFVADRSTKEPFDPARKINIRVKQEAMARGVLIYPMGGTIDGRRGDHVLLAPPFTVDATTIDTIVERLGDAVDAAIAA